MKNIHKSELSYRQPTFVIAFRLMFGDDIEKLKQIKLDYRE
jgi:hypothetical protein